MVTFVNNLAQLTQIHMGKDFENSMFPPPLDGSQTPECPASRQLTIVGGPGAGKTLFMQEMISRCGERAYCLSALRGMFPQRSVSALPGSIDAQFHETLCSKSYMRDDASCELEKLAYMLFVDEFDGLIELKERYRRGEKVHYRPTRLDRLSELWEEIFPDSKVVRAKDRVMFSTAAGEDLIDVSSLSQGETAVLYYIAAVLYARPHSVIFIDQPSLFIHPSVISQVWNSLEELRPDCRFVYDTVDVDFVGSRIHNVCVWVKNYDSSLRAWEYELLPSSRLSEELLVGLVGTRKPVLFIEGDLDHSIDAKLYRLVFTDYTVRPLGSCNKVIEATRSFNDLKYLHQLESHGIVDRDRRTEEEVGYLRRKNIFVPEVAEVENIFLLPDVIGIMARRLNKDAGRVINRVRQNIIKEFSRNYEQQALQHVRHRVKREVECKIDGRFTCISAMELHLQQLALRLHPRESYGKLLQDFRRMLEEEDYIGILRVFNYKSMLGDCGVDKNLGFSSWKEYVAGVLGVLKTGGEDAFRLRTAIKSCFGLNVNDEYLAPLPIRARNKRGRNQARDEDKSMGNHKKAKDSHKNRRCKRKRTTTK